MIFFLHTGNPGEWSPSGTHKPSLLLLRPFSQPESRGSSAGPAPAGQQVGTPSSAGLARRPDPELREWRARVNQGARPSLAPHPRRREARPWPLGPGGRGPRGAAPGAKGPRAPRSSPARACSRCSLPAKRLPRCRCRTPPPSGPGCP